MTYVPNVTTKLIVNENQSRHPFEDTSRLVIGRHDNMNMKRAATNLATSVSSIHLASYNYTETQNKLALRNINGFSIQHSSLMVAHTY